MAQPRERQQQRQRQLLRVAFAPAGAGGDGVRVYGDGGEAAAGTCCVPSDAIQQDLLVLQLRRVRLAGQWLQSLHSRLCEGTHKYAWPWMFKPTGLRRSQVTLLELVTCCDDLTEPCVEGACASQCYHGIVEALCLLSHIRVLVHVV
jgi:hypothetical protein